MFSRQRFKSRSDIPHLVPTSHTQNGTIWLQTLLISKKGNENAHHGTRTMQYLCKFRSICSSVLASALECQETTTEEQERFLYFSCALKFPPCFQQHSAEMWSYFILRFILLKSSNAGCIHCHLTASSDWIANLTASTYSLGRLISVFNKNSWCTSGRRSCWRKFHTCLAVLNAVDARLHSHSVYIVSLVLRQRYIEITF